MDVPNSPFTFVRVDQFTPNSRVNWISFGPVATCVQAGSTFTLTGVSPRPGVAAPFMMIYILGPKAFRVRFNPKPNYAQDGSFALVNKNLGTPTTNVLQNDAQKLSVNLGGIQSKPPDSRQTTKSDPLMLATASSVWPCVIAGRVLRGPATLGSMVIAFFTGVHSFARPGRQTSCYMAAQFLVTGVARLLVPSAAAILVAYLTRRSIILYGSLAILVSSVMFLWPDRKRTL